jgi:hypothetical protein
MAIFITTCPNGQCEVGKCTHLPSAAVCGQVRYTMPSRIRIRIRMEWMRGSFHSIQGPALRISKWWPAVSDI